MAIPTASRVAWPSPSAGATGPTSTNYQAPDRYQPRRRYGRGGGAPDPALDGKPRVIIAYDGFSLGQSNTR